ncbi:hypothetical protein CDAR_445791 [Caerostris darwini]|uniref:Uncharacterized protein n=1 Tax=Caerostris darwini TaxID=1538125 RepID=A0AAV4WK82_9ARAC|nr:hypothetical protein CDAR_445791 [Caerostris darwini]
MKCDWIEEWANDVMVERVGFGTGFCSKWVNQSSSVNSRLRIITNNDIWLSLFKSSRSRGISPVTALWSWEYGEPQSEFIGLGQFYEMREEGWILKGDWIEEWTTVDIAERELRCRLLFQMGKPVLKR